MSFLPSFPARTHKAVNFKCARPVERDEGFLGIEDGGKNATEQHERDEDPTARKFGLMLLACGAFVQVSLEGVRRGDPGALLQLEGMMHGGGLVLLELRFFRVLLKSGISRTWLEVRHAAAAAVAVAAAAVA